MKILLLVESFTHADISHALYVNALVALGHEVSVGDVNSVGFQGQEINCVAGPVTRTVQPYGPIPTTPEQTNAESYDLIWMLNQPHDEVAQDVWQLLWRLNQAVPFVNDVTGLNMLNNKNNLPLVVPVENLPESIGSTSAEELLGHVESRPDEKWILKDSNGGCGADVFVLSPGDTNVKALVQSMTGNVQAVSKMTDLSLIGLQARHALLQGYIPHVTEKRIALIAGEVVSAQEKTIPAGDHRGNVSQKAVMTICEVTVGERTLAVEIGKRLAAHGILFAGIDVAFPYIFEVNLVNPGGIVERYQQGESPEYLEPMLERLVLSAVENAQVPAS